MANDAIIVKMELLSALSFYTCLYAVRVNVIAYIAISMCVTLSASCIYTNLLTV